MTNLDSIFKSRNVTLPTKVRLVKAMVFPVVMYGCESWTVKKAERLELSVWTVVLAKTLEGPLDCKEIQPVHSEGDQPWDFFGRNDAKAETPVLWPPHAKSWLIGKDSDPGRDWGQEEKGMTEDEMAGWYHGLDGHESEWTPGAGDGQGGLAWCNSWGCKQSDTTERLNWTELERGQGWVFLSQEQQFSLARSFPWFLQWRIYFFPQRCSSKLLKIPLQKKRSRAIKESWKIQF